MLKSDVEIYIHIGLNKTGTTSIQRFAVNNLDFIQSQQIHYPNRPIDWDFRQQHSGLGKLIIERDSKGIQNFFESAEQEALNLGCSKIFVSGEGLGFSQIKHVIFFQEQLVAKRVKIVVCFREARRKAFSTYLSRSFSNPAGAVCPESFVKDESDIVRKIWPEVFGAKNYIELDFDEISSSGNLVSQFYKDVFQIEIPEALLQKAEKENVSLDLISNSILSLLSEYDEHYSVFRSKYKRLHSEIFGNKKYSSLALEHAKDKITDFCLNLPLNHTPPKISKSDLTRKEYIGKMKELFERLYDELD